MVDFLLVLDSACCWNTLVQKIEVDFIVFIIIYSMYCEDLLYVLSLKFDSAMMHVGIQLVKALLYC